MVTFRPIQLLTARTIAVFFKIIIVLALLHVILRLIELVSTLNMCLMLLSLETTEAACKELTEVRQSISIGPRIGGWTAILNVQLTNRYLLSARGCDIRHRLFHDV